MRTCIMVAAALAGLGAARADTILLTGATVHTVSGPDIPNGAVLIRDGKIAEVGAHIAARGARVIELKGLHLYPGMIDSATELGLTEIEAVREMSDITDLGLFKPQLRAATAVNPASEHIPVTRANGITAVITSPGGGIIAGQSVLMHLTGWTMADMAVRSPAAMRMEYPHIQARGRFFGGGEGPGRGAGYAEAKKRYEEQVQKLNDFMESARRYQKAKAAAGPEFETDLRFEAMLPVLEGKLPMLIQAEKAKTIKEAIAFAEQQKIHMILERGVEAWKVAADLKAHNIPVILPPTLRLPEEEDDPYDKPFTIPGELWKAGVKIAFASFGPGAEDNPRNLPYEAAAAVGFGLPQEEALKAVTLYPAQIWGVGDELGSIEKGKWADLIVTDGDPLETRTQIKQEFIKGVAVDLENKHRRLYEKYLTRD
ncbi:MAG TPA: amidohydrolase family protein [Bryobacteraceae bacterium]|nr:amidohydrolase family protein [Bryobacteraceae bacterium]